MTRKAVNRAVIHTAKRKAPRVKAPRQRPGAQTAGRALELLRKLVAHGGPISLAEITEVAKLDKSATYRLLRELESRSFVAREPGGRRYVIGSELIALSSVVLSKVQLRTAARPVLERLASMTQETVMLNLHHAYHRITIDGVEGPHSVRRAVPLGESLPLYARPTGKIMLAYLPEEDKAAVMDSIPKAKDRTFNARQIEKELAVIRSQGFLVSLGSGKLGHSTLAVPVFSAAGIIGAIAVSGPAERWTLRAIRKATPQVIAECNALSMSLGASKLSFNL